MLTCLAKDLMAMMEAHQQHPVPKHLLLCTDAIVCFVVSFLQTPQANLPHLNNQHLHLHHMRMMT